jgi:transcriptional regulator with XRE-family HTH domain
MPTIGKTIKDARYVKGMSLSQVSLMTDVSIDRIQAMERGNNPRLDDLLRVCSLLGIPLASAIQHPDRSTPWGTARHES